MIEIDDKIVSADLLRECFACDIAQCKGICCVEGNAGAPLEADEVEILEREYPNYKPYMVYGRNPSLFRDLPPLGTLVPPLPR